ncbi:MAG: hypothetical protein HOI95_08755 [Chromatiales bacterium]|nr:hypothetical protein [Chromatiales bacterium]
MFMNGLVLGVKDVPLFVSQWNSYGHELYLKGGAIQAQIAQNVMGGDAAGEINVVSMWDSIDVSMRAISELRVNPQISEGLHAAGVTTLRRSLFAVDNERGQCEGEFSSLLAVRGESADKATLNANADAFWSFLQKGANGQRLGRGIAGSQLYGMHISVVYTDSLDALVAASNDMWADSSIQERIEKLSAQPVSRYFYRMLG